MTRRILNLLDRLPASARRAGAGLLLLCLALPLTGCRPQADTSRGVELVLNTAELEPSTTFEIRFDAVVAKPGDVGIESTNSPLVITPALEGGFTWLSQRSGVFAPSEPLALATVFEVSLRPGLTAADGQPLDAQLRRVLQTPAFAAAGWLPGEASTNASSVPEIKVLFNAAVRAATVARFAEFRSADGQRVAADVRQGTVEERVYRYQLSGDGEVQTWAQRFRPSRPSAASTPPTELTAPSPTNEISNLLIATPRDPLPIGLGWKLVLAAGLPATERRLSLSERIEIPVGDVTPFTPAGVEAHNLIHAGRSITIRFSKTLPQTLTNRFNEWLELDPEPANLSATVNGRTLTLNGDFGLDTHYALTLKQGLLALEGFALKEDADYDITFTPVPPRLYFPAFSTEQLAGGRRTFPLVTINVEALRVRTKWLDPQTAIHALRGYASYFKTWSDVTDWNERYQGVDYNLVPGRTIYSQEFTVTNAPDAAQTITLDWDRILGGRKAGVVFLEAERVREEGSKGPRLGTQALIQLTDLGLVWKDSSDQSAVFVFSHTTGQPVANARVGLFSEENEALVEATTDSTGRAGLLAKTNAVWLVAQLGDDLHAVRLTEHNCPTYAFGLPIEWSDERKDDRSVLFFSDREVYRPGETLHLKAIVRDWRDSALVIPKDLKATLECFDARGRKFFVASNLVLSALGSWNESVPLPTVSRGYYRAQLHLGTQEFTRGFQVQDFRPDAFEVSVHAKPVFAAGEKIEAPVSAKYFFGKPLSRAKVHWSLEAEDRAFQPEKLEEFAFGGNSYDPRLGRGRSSFSQTGDAELTDKTNLVLTPEIPVNPAVPQPRDASLLVEITDLNQQTLSRRVDFVRHSSDFYFGLRRIQTVLTNGQPIPLEILAVGADGKAWPEPVKARVRLDHVEWQTVRMQGAGRAVRYRSEPVFTNVLEREIEVKPATLPAGPRRASDVHGTGITGIVPTVAGRYFLDVKATDAGGHEVLSSLDFSVSDAAELAWNYRNEVQIELVPDQERYRPGQTATLLVETPISGAALVTVEREKVLRSFVTKLEGNAPVVRVPIESGDAPNVFVSVTLVRGAADCPRKIKEPEYRIGYCQLAVEDTSHQLAVAIQSSATNFLPAAPVQLAVDVKDAAGAAVPDAEVTLYAVDEGVLSLTDYATPDPFAFFYQPRRLNVQSGISLPNLLTEDPEQLTFQNKGYLIGGGGRERVRKNFLACAFWQAALRTDANGKATASFDAPDSLTRYRVIAVAHTANSQFGHAQSAFQVSKPLIVEPALPAFANASDRIRARAVVLNQTDTAGAVVVSLELDEHAKPTPAGSPLTQKISIAAKGFATVEFPVELTEAGASKWTWRARFADASVSPFADAVQSMLAVGHVAPLLHEIRLARVSASGTNLLAGANPQLLEGKGEVTVTVANTRLIELGEAVSKLLHYPYGCVEQSSSSLLPWLVLRDVPALRPVLQRGTNNLDAAIRAGVARLLSMQTQSGGLGYWPRDREPMLWGSAYGGLALALAKRHGAAVPEEDFKRLTDYLSEQLRGVPDDGYALSERCLALYTLALAGRAEPAYHERYFEKREKLASEDRAVLALAVLESKGPASMVEELLRPARGRRFVEESGFGCAAREVAVRLLAWSLHRPAEPIVDTLVTDLMREQKEGHWTTTQGDAWAMLALAEYAARVEGAREAADGVISWGSESVPFKLGAQESVFEHRFVLATNLAAAPLKITHSSSHPLFTQVTLEARSKVTRQPRQDRGFSLERGYARLDDENRPQELKSLRVGDRVLVTLRLGVREPARYVALDDALPAVFEAVNPDFKTRQTGVARGATGIVLGGDEWFSDFHELRSDRALFFANSVEPGNYVIRYVARVRAAGEVTAPSAKVEEMYHPDRCGLTETEAITSQPTD